MKKYGQHIEIISKTLPENVMETIFETPKCFFQDTHVLYPADSEGDHLTGFFSVTPLVDKKSGMLIYMIAEDIEDWLEEKKLRPHVIFAPAERSAAAIANELAKMLEVRYALWEYHATGRFGDRLVMGKIKSGENVLVLNSVTQQGRCVGQRLPSFVERFGGNVIGAAVFAKGTAVMVKEAEERYGDKFYCAIQVEIPIFKKEDCPKCKIGDTLRPWTELFAN